MVISGETSDMPHICHPMAAIEQLGQTATGLAIGHWRVRAGRSGR